MSRFVDNAGEIFEVASAGCEPENVTILIQPEGRIRIVAESDWPLDSLQAHHGAEMAYRVTRGQGRVRVEGRSGPRSCLLETEHPAGIARRILLDHPRYMLATPALPAGTP